jgi:hypothetical protein
MTNEWHKTIRICIPWIVTAVPFIFLSGDLAVIAGLLLVMGAITSTMMQAS